MARKSKANTSLKDVACSLPNYLDEVEIIKSDIFILDHILKGGLELGSSIQLIAESGVGKSTIALQIAKNLCDKRKQVVYVDTESSITKEILVSTGVKKHLNKSFFYIKESNFDEVEKYLDMLINTNEISLVIIDSVAGLINKCFTNLDKGVSITTNTTLYGSRPLTNFMSKYKSLASSKKFCLLLINQYRNRIDLMKGTVLKEYGGKNVKYNSDIILKISPIKSTSINKEFKDMSKPYDNGTELEFEVIKSNKGYPEEVYPFYLCYGVGISNICNCLYAQLKCGVIQQNGAYYETTYKGVTIKEKGMKSFFRVLSIYITDIRELYDENLIHVYNSINSKE